MSLMFDRAPISLWLAIAGLGLAIGLAPTFAASAEPAGQPPAKPQFEDVLAMFDSDHPGRGADAGDPRIQDNSMTYAVYASAVLLAGQKDRAKIAVDWLVNNSGVADHRGWGLPYAWDAFSDGSLNPAQTIYGVTTAVAVRALLDYWEATEDEESATVAEQALDEYADKSTRTSAGLFFWYSDQAADAVETTNVQSILMGQYARAAAIFHRDDFGELADAAFGELNAHRNLAENLAFWPYSPAKPGQMNDLVHAAYTVQGLLDYRRWRHLSFDLDAELNYLRGFIIPGCVTNMQPSMHGGRCSKPARLWGIGMLVFALSESGDHDGAERVARRLGPYRSGEGGLLQQPGGPQADLRSVAHVLLGLARLAPSSP